MADPDGRYSISRLEPGVYAVLVSHPGFVPNRQADVNVKPDTAVELDLTLAPLPEKIFKPFDGF
jgi:hypothetical protein